MTPQRFQKIYDLFIKAREQPPDARCRFLNQACPEDDQLQREVEALLAAEVSPERLQTLTAIEIRQALAELENRAAEQVDSDGLPAGLHIEGFEILRELHRGGQGVVYQAVQRSTKRKVAIKVLLEGPYASRASKRRFERETELVAQLKHPNITAVFDSGLTADNRHYCVMDYVRGTPLQRYVRENGVGLEDAARLFAKVCDAVNYAHQKGVIHRDLKPSNILVDSDGEPKLLDFGLAKMVSAPVETIVSMTGQVVGTLPYMSPEQARGNPDEIDTRTDVYALGVIFYELLTGHYPYPVAGQMAEVLKHIAETPPTPPSRKWSKDSGITKRSDKRLRLGQCPIDDELQTIALKALAKERERRYQSAGGLVRDIEHYLAGEPIEAKRDSGLYVLKKTLKRYRAPVLVVALFVLLQAIGFVWIYALYSERGVHITEVESQLAAVCHRLVQEGRDMMNRKHWDLAVQKFDEALDLDPDFYPAIGSKAYALKKKYFAKDFKFGQTAILEESAQLCDRALELRPDRVGLWNLKAVLAYSLGDLQVAKAACLHALSLDPKYFNARSNLAKVLALQHEFKSALEEANTGVQVAATMAEDQFSDSVWRTLGVLQFHMGQAEAFESLKKAKSIAQDDAKNWLILARLYLGPRGYLDAPSAVREAEGAATFDKQSDPRISRMLALAYLRDQQYGEAVRHAQAAIENGDVHSYGHMIAAIAYAQMGDVRNAGLQLDRAVERLPSFDEDGTVVVCEKGLLWIDTAEELQTLRGEAEKLTDASQIQKGD